MNIDGMGEINCDETQLHEPGWLKNIAEIYASDKRPKLAGRSAREKNRLTIWLAEIEKLPQSCRWNA